MRAVTWAGRVAALVVALPLSGCAGMAGGYDVAPNGLARGDDELRRALAFEADATYRSVIEGERDLPDDDLLRLLYAGVAGRYAGAHRESSRLLDLASYLAEDRVTRSASREALSMITSDRALPYVPGRTERLMIPYLSALNFIEAGDLEGAAVEARRIEALLDRIDDGYEPAEVPDQSRFLHYFAGVIFAAAGDRNAAGVAFRRAGPVTGSLGAASFDGSDGPDGLAGGVADAASDSLGDVIVLVERGFVPHRVEQSVAVVLPPAQVEMLTDGSVGEKVVAATEAAARILATASYLYGDRSGYYRDAGYRAPVRLDPWRDDECRDGTWRRAGDRCRVPRNADGEEVDEAPYVLSVAWPVLYQEPPAPAPVRVRAGDRAVDAMARLDLSSLTRADFDAQRAELVARTVVRAAAKLAISSGLEDAVAEKDETAGRVVGILANMGALLTERADTRCWHLLPATVSMVRLRLPAGTHTLTLETEDAGDDGARPVALGTVEVRPGATTFLSTRLWR